MTETSDYRVAFTALAPAPLAEDSRDALAGALATMPGIEGLEGVHLEGGGDRLRAVFWIAVRLGMADAARDGSRLAREALTVAALTHTQLVDLSVSLRGVRGVS
ncbi:MAG: hypothetical protein RIB67_11235 [Miltoncostaeaceae bacterium]